SRQLRHEHLQARSVGRHPRAGEQLLPMQTVNAREEVGGALGERDERAHRDRNAARGKVAANTVEGREEPELLKNKPGQPFARHLGALVRGREGARRGALATPTTAARDAANDAPTLVLLHDVELLLDNLVDDVQSRSSAAVACVRTQLVLLRFEV